MNSTFEYIVSVVVTACVVVLFSSIFVDFYKYNKRRDTKQEKISIVATGSMVAFYLVYIGFLKFDMQWLPKFTLEHLEIQVLTGVLMVIVGTIINVIGRIQLKGNWANHIKIYKNHRLVTIGVYSYVRHPLYSSIIVMLYGGAMIYSSWLSALLVTIIFIPFMVFRAKQEEELLSKEFSEYEEYKKRVGLFFPKHLRRYQHE